MMSVGSKKIERQDYSKRREKYINRKLGGKEVVGAVARGICKRKDVARDCSREAGRLREGERESGRRRRGEREGGASQHEWTCG